MSRNGSLLSVNPSWPSLYNPRSELFFIQHHNPIQPGGFYLVHSQDVFRFTLYWTLVFYMPVFFIFGLYAFLNLSFPPRRRTYTKIEREEEEEEEEETEGVETYPMSPNITHSHNPTHNGYETLRSELTSPLHHRSSRSTTHPVLLSPTSPTTDLIYPLQSKQARKKRPKNARRSRVTFALLVLFTFLLLSLIGAVISSAIVGYILWGLYKAGGFFMSTWVPLLWAAITVMVGMLNVWPSVINLI